jgi:hypothetical protein
MAKVIIDGLTTLEAQAVAKAIAYHLILECVIVQPEGFELAQSYEERALPPLPATAVIQVER